MRLSLHGDLVAVGFLAWMDEKGFVGQDNDG